MHGYSPIAMAKNAIRMAIACEEYDAKIFANGATPGGILEYPGAVKDPERVRESWNKGFGGSSNANNNIYIPLIFFDKLYSVMEDADKRDICVGGRTG